MWASGEVRCGEVWCTEDGHLIAHCYPLREGRDESAGSTKLSLNDRKEAIMCQAVIRFDLVGDDWI